MSATSDAGSLAGQRTLMNSPHGRHMRLEDREDGCQSDSGAQVPAFEQECERLEAGHPSLSMKNTSGWADVSTTLHNFDEDKVKSNNENIDTLLVFAGLFSAILTAFIIEACKLLQQDPAEVTIQVLLQISQQLSGLGNGAGPADPSDVAPVLPNFAPSAGSIWVNALWFAALVLSLITVSLGMLVKQWLREYLTSTCVAPPERSRVRWFRRKGLQRYKVSEIASLLPLLLQFALVLFFAGLILFIRPISTYIASLVIALVSTWFLFLMVTLAIPMFSPSCPYKTPFMNSLYSHFRRLLDRLYHKSRRFRNGPSLPRYRRRIKEVPLFVEESNVSKDAGLDAEVLLDAYQTFEDVNIWEMVTRCVDLASPSKSIGMLSALVERKLGSPITHSSYLGRYYSHAELRLLMISLVACMRKSFYNAYSKQAGFILGDREAAGLILLERLLSPFRGCTGADWALSRMGNILLREAFSAPASRSFLAKYIPWRLGSAGRVDLPMVINQRVLSEAIQYTRNMIDGDRAKAVLKRENFKILCFMFTCLGRMTQDSYELFQEFSELTKRFAVIIDSFSEPSFTLNPEETFRYHCIFDMAMRLHVRAPGAVDREFFVVLHSRSKKLFNLMVTWKGLEGYIQQYRNAQRKDAAVDTPDWEKVLDGGIYTQVDARGQGEYDEEWTYQRLQNDCKHRIEFMLNFIGGPLYSCLTDSIYRL